MPLPEADLPQILHLAEMLMQLVGQQQNWACWQI